MIAWGTVPDWFAAVGTVGAFAIGLWLLRGEISAGEQRDREVEARAEDRRREQASLVALWASGDLVLEPQRAPNNRTYTSMTVHNASSLPITDVFAVVNRPGIQTSPQDGHRSVLGPGEIIVSSLASDCQPPYAVPMEALEVRFVDAAGRRWVRDGRGRLRAWEERPPDRLRGQMPARTSTL